MATYLSAGVYPREIDLTYLATGSAGVLPAFIGTANKGLLNTPTYTANAPDYYDKFGKTFAESYLGHAVLNYFEEGGGCYVQRVGIEYDESLPDELKAIAIDTSGAKSYGWGRVPVFSGIDSGRIKLRVPTEDNKMEFHIASTGNLSYNDIAISTTDGPTDAELIITNATEYTYPIDDSFTILVTSDPSITSGHAFEGATYQIYRNSDGAMIGSDAFVANTATESEEFNIGSGSDFTGLIAKISVISGRIGAQDSFSFTASPDNRTFSFWVDRTTNPVYEYNIATGTVCETPEEFAAAFNAGQRVGDPSHTTTDDEFYAAVVGDELHIRTEIEGQNIQLMGTEAWALEVGQSKYAFDIPRGHIIGTESGPYSIASNNNNIKLEAISNGEIQTIAVNIPVGSNQNIAAIVTALNNGGVYLGKRYWTAYALQVDDVDSIIILETTVDNQYDSIKFKANYSNSDTLRFVETIGVNYPYGVAYRGYYNSDPILPAQSSGSAATPLSCELDPLSSQCNLDSDYYRTIVGWFVATSPGTWINDYTITIEYDTTTYGAESNSFSVLIKDADNVIISRVDDATFDKTSDRYIGTLINPVEGVGGNAYINWIERPSELENDPTNDPDNYVVRIPATANKLGFLGAANGIPDDPYYSSELDKAVIGSPALGTGIYAYDNAEVYDINLLSTPGFSSGSVIGNSIQFCESRGDVMYVVDTPYGLRPSQAVDWHNGMLYSDLASAINTSYAACYWSWLKTTDKFSGENIWVPPSGHVLACIARTAREGEIWFAPAGFDVGRIYSATDIEYNPGKEERDLLYGYRNAINPIVNFAKDGLTIWGQRTLQRNPSARDRVNVRLLLIELKKNLNIFLRRIVFKQNDKYTWAQVTSVCSNYLSDVKARRGLDNFQVICNETNNTPERRRRNELWVSVLLQPTYVAEFIVLNLALVNQETFYSIESYQAAGVAV